MNFLDRFSKRKVRVSSFIKIRPVGAELFHTYRQTDMPKLIVAFRNFTHAPDNYPSELNLIVNNIVAYP